MGSGRKCGQWGTQPAFITTHRTDQPDLPGALLYHLPDSQGRGLAPTPITSDQGVGLRSVSRAAGSHRVRGEGP